MDERLNQAHPSTDEAFMAYLRRRAMENLAEYELTTRPWYRRVNWLTVAGWSALTAGGVLVWAFAAVGFVTVIS
jgi:hypothetical protein